ncbi:MAG: hypothetical protein KC646_00030 [Candidatus Cloacimonetes bacterium]|nr:hypothetical protein [Candidatus Cloacimonadota bacterium]
MLIFVQSAIFLGVLLLFVGWVMSFIVSYRIHTMCLLANVFAFPFNQIYLLVKHFQKVQKLLILYILGFSLVIGGFLTLVSITTKIVSNDQSIQFELPSFSLKSKAISKTHHQFKTLRGYKLDLLMQSESGTNEINPMKASCSTRQIDQISLNTCLPDFKQDQSTIIFNHFSHNKILYTLRLECKIDDSYRDCTNNNKGIIDSLQVIN